MSVPKSVPSAVAPSTSNSVPVNTEPQLGPFKATLGEKEIPNVPRSDDITEKNLNAQPGFGGGTTGTGSFRSSGQEGAPSVPRRGFLFTAPPVDTHYLSEVEDINPYHRVNNPPTRGKWQWLKTLANHIAYSQNTTNTGFKVSGPQQRQSVMRMALPPHGIGYAPETYEPRQLPQHDNTYKFLPSTGNDPYGTGVLNTDTYGAGQTAGGIGGNQYTPTPGGPVTTSTASNSSNPSNMPSWG
jgi:hypothetical protein